MQHHNKIKTRLNECLVNKLTILRFQQLVDDTTEISHLRGSRDGERNIIYQIPTEKSILHMMTHTYTACIYHHMNTANTTTQIQLDISYLFVLSSLTLYIYSLFVFGKEPGLYLRHFILLDGKTIKKTHLNTGELHSVETLSHHVVPNA